MHGIRVLDLTTTILGPLASQTLGDLGADVIKIEPPIGDLNRQIGPAPAPGMAAFFANVNRNKRSVVLDLKKPAALEALMHMVKRADVFMHGMRPQAAARLGIDYASISALNPRIVYGWSSGYRADGPRAHLPAYDDIIQGECGLAGLVGRTTSAPGYIPTVIADKYTGQMLASAIGMALFDRERTGLGQEVHVPMFETMLSFLMVEHLWSKAFDGREGGEIGYPRLMSRHRRPYATRDGYISIMANTDAHWRALLAALDSPEAFDDPRFSTLEARARNFDAIYGYIADRIRLFDTAELRRRLDAGDVPAGAVNTLEDLLEDEYLSQTGFFHRYEQQAAGAMLTTAVSTSFSRTPASIRLAPPSLGQHTEEVLAEFGLSAEAVAMAMN
ncbi:CaiB/BaiF CoA transferase family protein [Pigmentiphaga humi]|uniref:CaiB/BaiF CoA transferase family protein n=1 Tax=Pigmentiphaga humi TaxID=2478468 RepID=UPI001FE4BF18|nr:CoA transferase [Pigmentiphaga humi]